MSDPSSSMRRFMDINDAFFRTLKQIQWLDDEFLNRGAVLGGDQEGDEMYILPIDAKLDEATLDALKTAETGKQQREILVEKGLLKRIQILG